MLCFLVYFSGLGGMPSEVEPTTMNSVTSPTTTTTTLPNSTAASTTDPRPATGAGPGEKGGGGNGGGGKGSSPRGGRGSPRGSASPVGPGTPTGTGRRSPHGFQPSPSKDGFKSPTTGRTNGDSHSGEYHYYPSLLLPSTTTTIAGLHVRSMSSYYHQLQHTITTLHLPIPSTTTTILRQNLKGLFTLM